MLPVEVEKSLNDDRSYRYLTLPNGLRALLISDPTTEKSACCCDVRIGSFADDPSFQGLAHFLEHMLFLGTEVGSILELLMMITMMQSYPEENTYSSYLNTHGGSSNAYTSQEDTVYYFDILNPFLEEALTIFASFFIHPLFSSSAIAREINAIDNEHSKNVHNDYWRQYQLLKSFASKSHPFSLFSTGNLQTLPLEANGISIRDRLLEFYRSYYSANMMCLAVYSNYSLDVLESWVTDKFEAVPHHDAHRFKVASNPFDQESLQKVVYLVPIKDKHVVILHFPLPTVEPFYLSKPDRYIAHLLGHESEGSILAYLKHLGYANSLAAYVAESFSDFSCLNLSVELTDQGLSAIDEIVAIIFHYIGMLIREGPLEWIADEVKQLSELNFRYLNKIEPDRYVTRLASNMHIYPPQHVISGEEICHEVDLSHVLPLLQQLHPENCLIFVQSKTFAEKVDCAEPWYGTQYSVSAFTPEQTKLWKDALSSCPSQLHLPQPNIFVPHEFDIRSEPNNEFSQPRLIEFRHTLDEISSPGSIKPTSGRMLLSWHLLDTNWKIPKVNVRIRIDSYISFATPLGVSLTDVYLNVLNELLNEYAYYADCAGLMFKVQLSKGGLELRYSGYHHKLLLLIERTLQVMVKMKSTESQSSSCAKSLYDRMKEKLLRNYFNDYFFIQPYHQCVIGKVIQYFVYFYDS